jgi:hypothetical protein
MIAAAMIASVRPQTACRSRWFEPLIAGDKDDLEPVWAHDPIRPV